MSKEINLFYIGSFEITPLDEKPILFKHGEIVTFSTKVIVVPSPSNLYSLAKRAYENGNKVGNYQLISDISYRDNTLNKVLQAFKFQVPNMKEGTSGLYEVNNAFEFDSSVLPKSINELGGEIVFNLKWTEDNNQYFGNIINISLPIYEKDR